jgi:hypothetical protein
MAQWGWAYIQCSGTTTDIVKAPSTYSHGTDKAVLFYSSSAMASGSHTFTFKNTNAAGGTLPNLETQLYLTGNLHVKGAISASSFFVKHKNEISVSGSTYFGDSDDDVHIRTGSLVVTASQNAEDRITGDDANTYILSSSFNPKRLHVRGFGGRYRKLATASPNTHLIRRDDYILGVSSSTNITLWLPTASAEMKGAMFVIKDEYHDRSGAPNAVHVSAAAGSGNSIEDFPSYMMTGTMTAINLYCDGAGKWFVY